MPMLSCYGKLSWGHSKCRSAEVTTTKLRKRDVKVFTYNGYVTANMNNEHDTADRFPLIAEL